MTGGALPVRGGVVLSTEKMTRIKEINSDDLFAVVEPGVLTGDLQTAVEAAGLFYPPDPASLAICSLGGNVAENAGGPRAFKYGVTREYVLGLNFSLAGGESMFAGCRTPKGVTGYDVVGALVGSEGTFAVVTEMILKLLPAPPAVATLLAVFPDARIAGQAVSKVIQLGSRPRALELLDRATIEHLRGRTPYRLPENAGALLIVEIDGEPEGVGPAIERAGQACEKSGAVEVVLAQNESERRRLWETRRLANPTLKAACRRKIAEDIVVPRSQIAAMLDRVDQISAETKVACATYGHAGDGNLHINLMLDDEQLTPQVDQAMDSIMRATLDLGGTLAGEHGTGLLKMKYLPWEQSPPLLRLQRKLKKVFDPEDLLNPGKIIPND